jgi:hypothetical protein
MSNGWQTDETDELGGFLFGLSVSSAPQSVANLFSSDT